VLDTLSRPGGRLQSARDADLAVLRLAGLAAQPPDPAQVADAITRCQACQALREFRARLYECLTSRADASFELIDAILCADHAVTSLVQLSLEPEFRRGHGALYDCLSAGRIDDERLFSLLAEVLPPLVDGAEALAWIAEHDVIDHGLLEEALAGLAPDDAARVRDACARWSRLRFAVDATAYPRPDAWCSPGREHVHNGACHCRGSSKTAPGWEYQFTAATGHLRTAWAALVDVARTTPATRTAETIAQVKNVLRRLRAAGHGREAAPLFIFDAGYSAAALTDGLLGCPAHVLVRLAAGSVFYADPVTWDGKYGRPPRRGAAVHCLEPEDFTAAAAGSGPRGRKKPLPPNPEPDEEFTLPDTPLYGTVRAGAWHGVHPLIHGDRGWSPDASTCRSCPAPSSTSPSSACPTAATRTAPCGCGTPAPGRCPWMSSGAPTSPGSALSTSSSSSRAPSASPPRRSAIPGRQTAGPGSSWPRTPSSCSPGPWPPTCAAPGRSTLIPPARWHRAGSAAGFATSAASWGHPPVSRNPPGPGQAGPKAAAKAQHPAICSPAKPTCHAPRTRR
jgi:DDE superfamily endonuclease